MKDLLVFDKENNLLQRLKTKDLTHAMEILQLDGVDTLEISIRTNYNNQELFDKANYIGIQKRNSNSAYNLYKIETIEIDSEIHVSCTSAFEYEALGTTITPKKWEKVNATTILNDLFANSRWQLVDRQNMPETITVKTPIRYVKFLNLTSDNQNIISEVAVLNKQGQNMLYKDRFALITPLTAIQTGSVGNLVDNKYGTTLTTVNGEDLIFDLGTTRYDIETLKMYGSEYISSIARSIEVSVDGVKWTPAVLDTTIKTEDGFGTVFKNGTQAITLPFEAEELETVEYFDFDYTNLYEALKDVVNLFELEYWTEYIAEEGLKLYYKNNVEPKNPVYRYVHGLNAEEVTKEAVVTDTYTAGIGLGKVIDEETGERLTFENVIWNKGTGNPLNKAAGVDYIEFSDLTSKSSKFDGSPRKKYFIYDDIEDATILIKKTYDDLISEARPKVQYRANSIKLAEHLEVGDPVTIVRHDLGFKYITRVYKLNNNLLSPQNSTAEFGDILYASVANRFKNIKLPDVDFPDYSIPIKNIEDRVTVLEGQLPENVRPLPLDAKYFTYNLNGRGNYSVTGLSELGHNANAAGEFGDSLNLPEKLNGIPFDEIGQFRNIKFEGRLFVPYTYEYIASQGATDGLEVLFIDFEDFGVYSGMKYLIQSYMFRGNFRSGAMKLPPSVVEFKQFTWNGGNISRVDLPKTVYDRNYSYGMSDRFVPYDDYLTVSEGDFLIHEEANTVQIVGLSPSGAAKRTIIVPKKIKNKTVRGMMGGAFKQYPYVKLMDLSSMDIEEIPAETFMKMTSLTEVILPESIVSIGNYAFSETSLEKLTINGTSRLVSIGNYAFYKSTGTDFKIPDSIQSVGEYAFADMSNLSRIQLGFNMSSIPKGCFQNATSLSNITFPPGMRSVGDFAFNNSGIENLFIPKSLTSIGKESFAMTKQMRKVEFEDNTVGGNTFRFSGTHTFRDSAIQEVILPINYDTRSASDAFYACIHLTFPTIPDNWTTLSPSMFVGCSGFGDLDLSITNLNTIPSYAFHGCQLTSVTFRTDIIMDIAAYAFLGTQNFSEVTLKTGSKYSIGNRGSFATGTTINLV